MARAQLPDGLFCHFDVLLAVGVGTVHDLQKQVSLGDLLQGGVERLHQGRGKTVDKADGVGEQELSAAAHSDLPHRGVQRGEEHVRLEDLPFFRSGSVRRRGFRRTLCFLNCRSGAAVRRIPCTVLQQGIHHGGFPGVGVAHQGYQGQAGLSALFSPELTLLCDRLDLPAKLRQPVVDGAAVDLKLGLAFTLCGHGAGGTALAVLGLPHADEPRLQVVQLCQLHLESRFPASRPALEDLEDQGCAVHDGKLQRLLEIADLGRGEGIIENDAAGAHIGRCDPDLLRLSGPDIKTGAHLGHLLGHHRPGIHHAGLRKLCQFIEGVQEIFFRKTGVRPRGLPDAGQDYRFLCVVVMSAPYFICAEKCCHLSQFLLRIRLFSLSTKRCLSASSSRQGGTERLRHFLHIFFRSGIAF